MWVLLAIAWSGLIALALAVRRRLRLPQRTTAAVPYSRFVDLLKRELQTRRADVKWCGMVSGQFTAVLAVNGQETPVPLQALYQHFEAFPDALGALVDRLIREIRADGLDLASDYEFADIATLLMPQLKSLAWVRERGPMFGDSAIVHRVIGEDLALCYVIDDDWSMVYVCRALLKRWGRDEADLFNLTTRNLARTVPQSTLPRPQNDEEPVVIATGDGYDAARVLLLDPKTDQDLLIAMPDRDVLWLGVESQFESERLGELMQVTAQQSANSTRPVSAGMYRLAPTGLERVTTLESRELSTSSR